MKAAVTDFVNRRDTTSFAYIGLGSNLGDPLACLRQGIAALARLPASRIDACSSLYHSAPIGITAQPHFLNAVCRISTRLSPQVLLGQLLAIELAHGRMRHCTVPGEARTLDLDLLLYGEVQLREPELVLPHPRMHLRGFVLHPLCEIDPAVVIPGRGAASHWLDLCGGQEVRRIAGPDWHRESRSHEAITS